MVVPGIANSFEKDLENKFIPKSKKGTQKLFVNAGLNFLHKKNYKRLLTFMGSKIMLTNNEIKIL